MTRNFKLIAVVVAVAIIGGWYVALWRPATKSLAAADAQLATAQSDQLTAALAESEVRAKVRRLPQEEAAAAALSAAVPTTPQVDVLLDQVGAIAGQAGVAWQSESQSFSGSSTSSSTSAASTPGGLQTMSLDLSVSGTTPQLLRFVTLLQAAPRVIQVSGLDVSNGNAALSGPAIPGSVGATSGSGAGAQSTSIQATLYVDSTALPAAPKSASATAVR